MTFLIAIGWQRVLSHFGAIIIGSFSTKSRIISNEVPPEPIIMAARKTVSDASASDNKVSAFFLELRCFERESSLEIPLR